MQPKNRLKVEVKEPESVTLTRSDELEVEGADKLMLCSGNAMTTVHLFDFTTAMVMSKEQFKRAMKSAAEAAWRDAAYMTEEQFRALKQRQEAADAEEQEE